MKGSKVIYWIAVISLGFYTAKNVILPRMDGSISDILAITIWVFLSWMLFRRPQSWGLGIGIFMLIVIAIQIGLWRLALTSPKKDGFGVSDSWLKFALSVCPLLVGGICSISLHWLLRNTLLKDQAASDLDVS